MAGKVFRSTEKSKWFDEVSPMQYKYPTAAVHRREIMNLSLDGKDFHGDAFRILELQGHERILNVGSGDGRDEVRLATEFNHEGLIVGLDVPATNGEFQERFITAQDQLDTAGIKNVSFVPGNALALPFPDNSFEVVMWVNSGYHFQDVIRALYETQRVLVRGGKFLNLTNAFSNKTGQHGLVGDIKSKLGVPIHLPFSAGFNMEISQQVIPVFFKPLYEGVEEDIEQRTLYGITADTKPYLENSIESYRVSESEDVYKGWLPVQRRVIEQRVEPVIESGYVWTDTLHRGGGAYENEHHIPTSLQKIMGRRLLKLAQQQNFIRYKRAILNTSGSSLTG
ncbi:methyltransferase domain-containing protein [Candidatus Saccharibacteria bacterium]|nr:methyltransferase domain-containing protein [Candidatus Saccharibacteria bacterium]